MKTDMISNSDDLIDSRDVIARIEYLTPYHVYRGEYELESFGTREEAEDFVAQEDHTGELDILTDHEDEHELRTLRELASQGQQSTEDWGYGETLIRDSYFEDYARDYASDVCGFNSESRWPYDCIDWKQAADELQMDYTSVDFDGVTYWVR